ncbi:MAG: hypothetical protein QN194_15515 [Armatimonadota bacterium]|nr:hypothetical protein [Armatimonadota bacterium]
MPPEIALLDLLPLMLLVLGLGFLAGLAVGLAVGRAMGRRG